MGRVRGGGGAGSASEEKIQRYDREAMLGLAETAASRQRPVVLSEQFNKYLEEMKLL